jgi:hypothetical protein
MHSFWEIAENTIQILSEMEKLLFSVVEASEFNLFLHLHPNVLVSLLWTQIIEYLMQLLLKKV